MSGFPHNNRTYSMLKAAQRENYAVGAFSCYNTTHVLGVIRAAEANGSPAIIQLFPWSLHFHGPQYVAFVVSAAHAARVPIAVHLDHCIIATDAELALSLRPTFDSIMVDGDAVYVRGMVERAAMRGVTIEAELGRIAGAEDGLPPPPAEAMVAALTEPDFARRFVEDTGIHFLAPSFGNVHGTYPEGGPEACWKVQRLGAISAALEGMGVEMVLHGTSPAGDELIRSVISQGVRKINMNKMVRDAQVAFLAENTGTMPETQLQEKAVEIYANEVGRAMREVLGSAGKATEV
ncbi:fructose-bisphosphate aldolase [Sphaerosporella brunnea]|uniref:Fructose-bisphosphate aldolase n=1 Tax=Sphaerosporella brunnea TaxID=1250544 RepID=A0A5J5F4N6_9PEZI|nr:fructose-bisphosphate aldolase [Sphaerosporella brunnea]